MPHPNSAPRTPKYRHHKARDSAVVTLGGRDFYLGEYGSPASRELYHRLVAEHLAGKSAPPVLPLDAPLTVTELVARYWAFAKTYYVKDGRPTSEVASLRVALRFVRRLYGPTPAAEFSPKRLKAVREAMTGHERTRRVKGVDPATGAVTWARKVVGRGLARKCLNKMVGRVKRVFAWAVEEELVAVGVHAALLRVKGLQKGKSAARETPRVRPVADADVDAVLPHLPAAVRAMVQVQRLTGCRPQDVVQIRGCDLDRSGEVWEYRPRAYKTQHHDADRPDRERVIHLGPKCQAVLRPWLAAAGDGFLFSPKRSEDERNAARRASRTTPRTPSSAARGLAKRAKAPLQEHYAVASYRQAIRRACGRAGVGVWKPHQLRHSRLTEIRARFGLEASRVVGGHREVGATQLYAEEDRALAVRVMAELG